MHWARIIAPILVAALTLASSACGKPAAPVQEPVVQLTFGVPPIRAKDQLPDLFNPTLNYVSRKARVEIKLRVTDDYNALVSAMEKGEVDMGWFSPVPYVQAAKTGKTEPILEAKVDGTYAYSGLLITRKDSGLKTVEDLKGRSFAFVDKGSSSGYVYPAGMLLDQGINPNTYFGSVAFAGGHDKVVEGVLNRTYEAGAISDNVLPELQRVRGLKVDELEIVARTTPIPQSVIAVRTAVDQAVRERIRYVMTEMGYNVEGKAILAASSLGMQGFAPIGAQDFEATRKIVTLVENMPTDTKKP